MVLIGKSAIRHWLVHLHRWFGLFLAGFLLVEGVTGSLLAFKAPLTRWLNPQVYAQAPRPGARRLGLGELAQRAEESRPDLQVDYFFAGLNDGQVTLRVEGRPDPSTGKSRDLGFKYLVVDPCTGAEIARLRDNFRTEGFWANVMPFAYGLHIALSLGDAGTWILSAVALVWTVDCFVGFYLTLPAGSGFFWPAWRRAWQIKRASNPFALSFDFHRAGGLWFWLLLFVFAWSGAGLVEHSMPVYEWVMGRIFPYQTGEADLDAMPKHAGKPPKLGWRAAQAAGEKLLAEQAALQGFNPGEQTGFAYLHDFGLYSFDALTDRSFPRKRRISIMFDGDTGKLYSVDSIPGDKAGNLVNDWLRALHMISDPVDYLVYRWVVCLAGLVTGMLSVTGVYLWWRKRRARSNRRRPGGFVEAAANQGAG
jgi:uncharacterized iron-regulated membrane protein